MNFEGFKVAIYIDHDNLVYGQNRTGLNYKKIIAYMESLGMQVVRATTYMAVDYIKEGNDEALRAKNQDYRKSICDAGFRVFEKKLMRYENEDGITYKGNTDIDMAVDALTQSKSTEFVLLGTGDGDFVPLVRALQNMGKRVEGFAFRNYSGALIRAMDGFHMGSEVSCFEEPEKTEPVVTPVKKTDSVRTQNNGEAAKAVLEKAAKVNALDYEVIRGKVASFNVDKGFGFITPESEMDRPASVRDNIYFHITDVRDTYYQQPSNLELHEYMVSGAYLEFVHGVNDRGEAAKHIRLMETR